MALNKLSLLSAPSSFLGEWDNMLVSGAVEREEMSYWVRVVLCIGWVS